MIPSNAFEAGDVGELARCLARERVNKELAAAIIVAEPRSREAVVRAPAVQALALRDARMRRDIVRVMVAPAGEVIPPAIGSPREVVTRVHEASGLLMVRATDGVSERWAVADGSGEIASGEWSGKELDHLTFRLFGLRPWDAPSAQRETRRALSERLLGPLRRPLYRLYSDERLDGDDGAKFRILAAAASYVGSTSGGAPVVDDKGNPLTDVGDDPGVPTDPAGDVDDECGEPNGCGPESLPLDLVPDGTWKACCDQHDRCYCTGDCDTCGRLECDNAFLACLTQGGSEHITQGMVYYLFVRALGNLGAYECDEPFGIGAARAIEAGVAVGIVAGLATGSWEVGVAAGAATTAIASKVFCEVCEPIHEWRQEVQETIQELADPQWVREAIRKCNKKKKWWKRWTCKVKKIVGYVWRLIIAIILVPVLLVLWVLELNTCGA